MEKTTAHAVLLGAADVDALPFVPLGPIEGATHRILWRDGTSMSGVLRVAPDHHLGQHAHRVNHHHLWVLDGQVTILGRELGPGSYVHVPAGVDHDIAAGPDGGTVYYLYLPGR